MNCSTEHIPSWQFKIPQIVKKFFAIFRNRKVYYSVTCCHFCLSWVMEVQSNLSHPISLRAAWILYSHLHVGQPSCVFSSGFLTKDLCVILSSSTHTIRPASQERVFWNLFYDFKGLINSRNFFAMSLGPFCQHDNGQSRKAGGGEVRLSCRLQYELQKIYTLYYNTYWTFNINFNH